LTIAQQHIKEPTYSIREDRHRGQEVGLVGFDHFSKLYRRCKELGSRYTRTQRGWWWPLSDRVLVELRKYFKMYQPGDNLFQGPSGGKYSNRSTAQLLNRAVKRAGITIRLTFHTLRHSFSTHFTNQGVNIRLLQEILGHKSSRTAMLYALMSGKDIRKKNSSFMAHYMPFWAVMGVKCAYINELYLIKK